ncbi:MAG TPA: hypothetical protein VMU87_02750 [Stellaceae bacterium]|nr:hypothetical protein [Stellaceae bacterium]
MPDPFDRAALLAAAAGRSAADRGGVRRLAARSAVAAVAGAAAAAIAVRYPLHPALLLAVLAAYAGALWRWPSLWIAVVPAALPAFDFGPWSGWTFIEEPDLLVLATSAVLALRAPPRRGDFRLRGIAGAAVALTVVATFVGIAFGLALPGPAGGTAIAELSPLNALRIAKALGAALALLPFLRRALDERDDALDWLAAGMTAGLVLVTAAAAAERAVFTGPFDFHTVYRIVGTFSSMHFGGGYIGVYIAMALPFLFVLPPWGRFAGAAVAVGVAIGALYTLVVTFARAAYASAVIASVVVALGAIHAARRRGEGLRAMALPLLLLAAVGAIAATAASDARFMVRRLDRTLPDLDVRLAEWRAGLALGDSSVRAALFGMGLGSYARIVLARRPGGRFPTNIALHRADGRSFLRVHAGLPLYLGQKVSVAPQSLYRVSATLRGRAPGSVLVVFLCEKLLLYSVNCEDVALGPAAPGQWQRVSGFIPSGSIGERSVFGLKRPVDLSLFVPERGTTLDIADVRFEDRAGRALVVNGDFADGLDHWLASDDDHAIWRIENQYLMTFFEGGALGLTAFLVLVAAAFAAALRAMRRGHRIAPALAAAIAAFLASSLFDCTTEVPRLGALFYLVAFAALALDARGTGSVTPAGRPGAAAARAKGSRPVPPQ